MNHATFPLACSLVFAALTGCASTSHMAPAPEPTAATSQATTAELVNWLVGRFDSRTQASESPDYFAVSLEMCRMDAPELGEHVLYVEQAMVERLEAPYRQRVYVVSEEGGSYVSKVYELADPAGAVGGCGRDGSLSMGQSDVEERTGCAVQLRREGARYVGSTVGSDCTSSLKGASYATSEVEVHAGGITSWDRGYDANGVQVWGAVAGPYRFDRRE